MLQIIAKMCALERADWGVEGGWVGSCYIVQFSRYSGDFSREVVRRSRDSSLDMLAREEERRKVNLKGDEDEMEKHEERRVIRRAVVLEEKEEAWETLRASTEEILSCPRRRQGRKVEDNGTQEARWALI